MSTKQKPWGRRVLLASSAAAVLLTVGLGSAIAGPTIFAQPDAVAWRDTGVSSDHLPGARNDLPVTRNDHALQTGEAPPIDEEAEPGSLLPGEDLAVEQAIAETGLRRVMERAAQTSAPQVEVVGTLHPVQSLLAPAAPVRFASARMEDGELYESASFVTPDGTTVIEVWWQEILPATPVVIPFAGGEVEEAIWAGGVEVVIHESSGFWRQIVFADSDRMGSITFYSFDPDGRPVALQTDRTADIDLAQDVAAVILG